MAFFYEVYGLKLKSDLELPELIPIDANVVDVIITLDKVPQSLPGSKAYGAWAEYESSRCLFRIQGVARFLIEHGRSICVEPYRSDNSEDGLAAPIADIRLYLLGSALAALLHQRSLIPLHVSAVSADNGVWAFTGPSGAGKSTLAGWLSQCVGLPLISDDVSVVEYRGRDVRLLPGPRKLKLWHDAIGFLDIPQGRLVQDLSNTPKFQLYLRDEVPESEPQLSGLVFLERAEPGELASLTAVTGIDRFRYMCRAVYRHYMAVWFRSKAGYVKDIFELTDRVPVYRLRRPWSLEQLGQADNPLWSLLQLKATQENVVR